jgi:hypothetical protein
MPIIKIFSIIWLAAMIVLPDAIYGQDAKLIDGAKKEGGKGGRLWLPRERHHGSHRRRA